MLGSKIKALRKENKMTQSELSQKLSVSQQAVAKWEAGKSFPEPFLIKRLAGLFSVTADFLLDDKFKKIVDSSIEQISYIPVVGHVRAGFNSLAFEEELGREPAFVRTADDYLYFLVQGDSMEPMIHEGDFALIRKQRVLENGDLGVFIIGDGEGTLKKFFRRNNEVMLVSFNESYPPITISGESLNDFYIIGKVVETKHRWE